jgi:hypothetical protein
MIITKIDNESIYQKEKNIEISVFDKQRGFMIKENFNIQQKLYIDLNPFVAYTCNFLTTYAPGFEEYDNFTFYGKRIPLKKELREYINEQNRILNIPHENEEIKQKIDKKIKEIEELYKQLK